MRWKILLIFNAPNIEERAEELWYGDDYKKQVKKGQEFVNKIKKFYDIDIRNFNQDQAIEYLTRWYEKYIFPQAELKKTKKERIIEFGRLKAQLDAEIANIKSGEKSGINLTVFDKKTGKPNSIAIGIEENAVRNRRSSTIPHEIAHALQEAALMDPATRKKIGEDILELTKEHFPDVHKTILRNSTRVNNKGEEFIDYSEVYANFLEFYRQNKLQIEDSAKIWQEIFHTTTPDFNFANVNDLVHFARQHVDYFLKKSKARF